MTEREYNSEQVPLDEIFTNKEMNRLRFEKWRLQQTPENQTPTAAGVVDWQKFRRRELIKQMMRK